MTKELFDLTGKRVYVAGHRGMVGGAVVRRLVSEQCKILTVDRTVVDLTNQTDTDHWIGEAKPDAVILAAARVGGIAYNNDYPVDFLFDNLAIELNVIRGSYRAGVQKLLFLGSSCIYPRSTPQPMTEDMLLTGLCEVAKIAGALAYGSCQVTWRWPAHHYGLSKKDELPAVVAIACRALARDKHVFAAHYVPARKISRHVG